MIPCTNQIKEIILAAWCAFPQNLSHGTLHLYLHPSCNTDTCPTKGVVYFACDPEFYLVGYGSIWCVGCGEWNLPMPYM